MSSKPSDNSAYELRAFDHWPVIANVPSLACDAALLRCANVGRNSNRASKGRLIMRKQYYFKPSNNGFYAWDVDKLVAESKNFPIIEIEVTNIKELSEPYWYADAIPTCKSIVDHFKILTETSLECPIILAADNSVMDGMHRVCKAYLENKKTINAVKFKKMPEPDYEDVTPEDLPYERSKNPKYEFPFPKTPGQLP